MNEKLRQGATSQSRGSSYRSYKSIAQLLALIYLAQLTVQLNNPEATVEATEPLHKIRLTQKRKLNYIRT